MNKPPTKQHHRDRGIATTEILMWTAVLVVVIAGIGALLQTLGMDVIAYVRTQIGI